MFALRCRGLRHHVMMQGLTRCQFLCQLSPTQRIALVKADAPSVNIKHLNALVCSDPPSFDRSLNLPTATATATATRVFLHWSQWRIPGPPCPQDFFTIMQFSGNFKGNTPILSDIWAQATPLGSKLYWAPLTKILDLQSCPPISGWNSYVQLEETPKTLAISTTQA